MSSRRSAAIVAALALCSSAAYAQQKGAETTPGVAADDRSPNGCVDCHKAENDLLAIMGKYKNEVPPATLEKAKKAAPQGMALKGKHPDVSTKKNIPQDCLVCHKAGSKLAPPLSRLSHVLHFSGGGKNPFVSQHGGACTHCHKVDADTGNVAVKMPPKK